VSTCSKMIEAGSRRILVDAKEPALVSDLLDSLREELPSMPLSVHDDPVGFASAAVGTSLFDDDRKILVLWELDADGLAAASQALSSASGHVLLFVQRRSIPKSRQYTRLRADCELLTLEGFDERGCRAYAAHQLRKAGCEFDADVPEAVVERHGTDLAAIRSECRKLSFLGRRLDRPSCLSAMVAPRGAKLYDLVDSVLRRRWGPSLSMSSTMDTGELVSLVHLMQAQARRLYLCSLHKDAGMSNEDVAGLLGLPPYIVRTKIAPVAAQLGRGRILRLMDLLSAADVSSRVSRLPRRELLEATVARLMRI